MNFRSYFDNQIERGTFIRQVLGSIEPGSKILDAGAGSQQYKKFCSHLKYFSQDFGKVTIDKEKGFASLTEKYEYGETDYLCDITKIPVNDGEFDVVMCTEVFEHIPDPVLALRELTRILKSGGIIILTVPSNCLRHFDPYFFYSGFSNNFLTHWFSELGFEITQMKVEGNYFKWISLELARTVRKNPTASIFLFPAFLYFFIKSLRPSSEAVSTLCGGYYVVARKK